MHTLKNKSIKRFGFIIIFSLIIMVLFAACGSANTQETAATQPEPQEVEPTKPVMEPQPTEEVIEDEIATPEMITEEPVDEPSGAAASFASDVLPILQNSCVRCHGPNRAEDALRLDSYENVIAGSKNGPVVIAGDPLGSLLVELSANGEMPKRGARLTAAQVQILTDWVTAGANND